MIPDIQKTKEVVDALQDWIDAQYHFGWTPVVSFVYAGKVVQVSIGDCCVFDSEEGELLSVDDCLDAWHDHIRELYPFFPDLKHVVTELEEWRDE